MTSRPRDPRCAWRCFQDGCEGTEDFPCSHYVAPPTRPRDEIGTALDALVAVSQIVGKRGHAEGDEYRDARARVEELFARLRDDALRLDWIEANPYRIQPMDGGGWLWQRHPLAIPPDFPTLRSAIDAARSSSPDTPK